MKYTELYFMIQTYGFFILLGIFGLAVVTYGIWCLIDWIKNKKRNKKRKQEQDNEMWNEIL